MFLQRCTVGNAAQTSEKMEVGCSSKGANMALCAAESIQVSVICFPKGHFSLLVSSSCCWIGAGQ